MKWFQFNLDTYKAFMTYMIALVIIVGGMVFLWKVLSTPLSTTDNLTLLIVGAVITLLGNASAFVFGLEIATRSARQSERASAAGASQALTQPSVDGELKTPPPPGE